MYNGHVDEETDQNDYYYLVLSQTGSLYVRLGWYNTDAFLNLYINGVVYDNSENPSAKQLIGLDLPAGTYYVRVEASTAASDYWIRFSPVPMNYECYDDCDHVYNDICMEAAAEIQDQQEREDARIVCRVNYDDCYARCEGSEAR